MVVITSCLTVPLSVKKPQPAVLVNYMSISSLPFISKILERVVLNQLTYDLQRNGLFEAFQPGFYQNTETASVKVMIFLLPLIMESYVVVMLDLSAAFNTIDHDILL